MSTVVELEDLGSFGFKLYGHTAFDQAGASVSGVGDFNNDGYDDFIVGAPFADSSGNGGGAAYVIYGGPNGLGDADLANLADARGFRIDGEGGEYGRAGIAVSGAGDVNGDGFDDLIISAVNGSYVDYYNIHSTPTAYVIYGRAGTSGAIDLGSLSQTDGFAISAGTQSGFHSLAISDAGDINNDGFDDVIIGRTYANGNAGAAYVIFGRQDGYASVDLENLGSNGFVINGAGSGDYLGISVSAAGDVNGDGFADVIIGAPNNDSGGNNAGAAYVILGNNGPFGTINLSLLVPGAGFVIQGSDGDVAGLSVSDAGDFNGDGYSDIIVAAPFGYGGGLNGGGAYVIFGHGGAFPALVDVSNLGDAGFAIQGGDHFSGTGDVNGDGFDDLIISAVNGSYSGWGYYSTPTAYVIYGRDSTSDTIHLGSLSQTDGFAISGSTQYGWFSLAVSAAGDINSDGLSDVLIGSSNDHQNGDYSGAAYVIFGRGSFTHDPQNDFNGDGRADVLWRNDAGAVVTFHGQLNGSFVGNVNFNLNPGLDWHIEGTGDFNGDGYDDILWRNDAGVVVDLLGQDNGSFVGNVNFNLNPGLDWHIEGTGDFNGDHFDDILWRNDAGAVVTLLGEAGGSFIGNVNFNLNPGLDWHIAGTGDFNGDGYDDILWRNDAGVVVDLLGQDNGSFVGNVNFNLNPGLDWHIMGTGDFNGDGYDDILWRNDAGVVVDLLGQDNGSFVGNVAVNMNPGAGSEVAATGDYDGDGRDDILWRDSVGNTMNWLGQPDGGFVDNSAVFSINPGLDWQVQPEPGLVL